MRLLAVLTVRNEGAFLLDWLAHHMAAGFTDFLVFSNDCDDGTDRMLDRLAQIAPLAHIRNDGPYDKGGIQFTALKHADRTETVRQADWILALDIDEFVNIHVGDHTVPALLCALPEAMAIPLTWRLFGNGGVVEYTDQPVPRTFTGAAPSVMHWPWRASMFKTLFRNDGTYRKLGVHRPRNPDPDRIDSARWFDGEGRELPPAFRTERIFSDYGRPNHRLAQLNHYPLGAKQSFVLKADRGRAVHADQMLDIDYWVERDFNTEQDSTILALAPRADRIRASLGSDSELADLHERAVNWRHARFEQLMGNELFRNLFGRLLMTQPSHPVPSRRAAMLVRHAVASRASKS
ncbi:MAG: glycosyltransferase family 2 protein [Marinibacterium sp.]